MIRTRFAPSPTGDLHIGGIRTALFSWLFARHHNGQFILRIEDTDQSRSTPSAIQKIITGLDWLGLNYDEGPYYQSQRTQHYQHYLDKLLKEGSAYICSCSTERLGTLRETQRKQGQKPRYDGHCRSHTLTTHAHANQAPKGVIRFKNPQEGIVTIKDHVLGTIQFNNAELDDFIIARSDGTPTYNFTVVVDDYELSITHVIRGNDHLNNTPKQINLLKALGASIPIYMHLPMLHSSQGKKLSKRDGAASVMEYQKDGFLKEAMINYLARLGWSHGNQEIFSIEELIYYFDGKHITKSPATLNLNKLLWLNQHYLKNTNPNTIATLLQAFTQDWRFDEYPKPSLSDIVLTQRERVKTLKEMANKSRCFFERPARPDTHTSSIDTKLLPAIHYLHKALEQLTESTKWHTTDITTILKQTLDTFQLKPNQLFQALRTLLVGANISPPMDVTIALLGKERVLARLSNI